jgi:hypothetical protein
MQDVSARARSVPIRLPFTPYHAHVGDIKRCKTCARRPDIRLPHSPGTLAAPQIAPALWPPHYCSNQRVSAREHTQIAASVQGNVEGGLFGRNPCVDLHFELRNSSPLRCRCIQFTADSPRVCLPQYI